MTLRQSDSAALNIPITMGLGAVLVVCRDNVDPAQGRKGPPDAPGHASLPHRKCSPS
jgi:hypothetical protein